VRRISPGSGFTNNSIGRAMGKAGTIKTPDGSDAHAVLIHLHALDGACGAIFGESCGLPRRPATEENCMYLIYHELGHCLDNHYRPMRPQPVAVGRNNRFEISRFKEYHADIVEEEYAASKFARRWMTQHVFSDIEELLANQLKAGRAEAAALKAQHAQNPDIITTLASSTAGWCWSLLIQVAKLSASRGFDEASNTSEIWPEPDKTMTKMLVSSFERALELHWAKYPVWSPPVPNFMGDAWQTLALLEGFKFVEDERGSAVYWR
jgi:hypothetical protein